MINQDVAHTLFYTVPVSLTEAQKIVDGYVELVWVNEKTQLLVNDEGMWREDLLPNPTATKMAINSGYMVHDSGIRGNAVVLTEGALWE
jgi:hypothetical protein